MKRLLLFKSDSDAGAAAFVEKPEDLIKRLLAENEALKQRVTEFDAKAKAKAEEEKTIVEKTQVGLSRAQAIAVIQRQKDHDAALEKVWAERRPEIVQVLKDCKCTKGKITREARMRIREIHGAIVLDEILAAQKSIGS